MYVVHSEQAKPYEAPGHYNMHMHRLQGKDVTPLNGVWSAKLTLHSGGQVDASTSPAGKLYIVESGSVEFTGGNSTVVLNKGDTVFVPPLESRAFKAMDQQGATLYLIMLEDYKSAS
jgi:quercetin dioxygenase-like cupin family protein